MFFSFAKLIKTLVKPFLNRWQLEVDKKLPRYNLTEKHLNNAKIIANREKLLDLLPKNAVVAELGVDKGDFTQMIIDRCSPKKLHLVDSWSSKRYNEDKMNHVRTKFEVYGDTIQIHVGLSTDVVKEFKNNYFDWIYIDTDHSYQTTKRELELYQEKVKARGIIAGHDFSGGNWRKLNRYGVIEAVYEFCNKYSWEILYVTAELSNNLEMPSFAIKNAKNL